MSDLIANLGINWKILLSQIVNFAILVFLLQRFAYKPLLGVLNARRDEIRKAHENAKEIEQRLKDAEAAKEATLETARKSATELIKKAELDAAASAERIVRDAKADMVRVSAEEKTRMLREREALMQEATKHLGETVALAVEKTVGDVMDEKSRATLSEHALQAAQARTAR